jgi:hypothetical protein
MRKRRSSERICVTPRNLKDLKNDPNNARKHNPRNLAMIRTSMERVGAARSIVIDEQGIIRAGEGAVHAARKVGMKLRIVDADGRTLIAVRRRDLTDAQKTELALYDNRTAELADWDAGVLWLQTQNGSWDIQPFFNDEELKILLMPDESGQAQEVSPSLADLVKIVTCPKCGEQFPV